MARARGWKTLGTGMAGMRSTDGKNRTLIIKKRSSGEMVQVGGGGNSAPVDLDGGEGQGKGV